jgi:hypothetical protein
MDEDLTFGHVDLAANRRMLVEQMAGMIAGSPLAVRIAQAAMFDAEPWNATRLARAIYDQAEAMVAEGERRAKAAAK